MISIEDRMMIHELISLHGHFVDEGRLDELSQVFSPDVIYDLDDFGFGALMGIDAVKNSAISLGDTNPVGHHITNIVLSEGNEENTIYSKSKGIGIKTDGSCGSVIYEDIIKKQSGEWRITYRKVIPRRKPLGGKY
jgi:hypothetical protein